MKITILYDNQIFKKGLGLKSDWGFSSLIQNKKDTILFDCGAKGDILLNNMKKLNLNPLEINKIVISHEHWDHNGGLKSLINCNEDVEIFRLKKDFNEGSKNISIKESIKISNNIYSTGKLSGIPVDEQSLILKEKSGGYVLTGCSHSGVDQILKQAQKFQKISGLIGGFHGFNKLSILKDLNYICPCHCTKHKKEILKKYPTKSSICGVGKIIDLEK